jgi:putative peptidoglycan lipid II flippase
MSIATTLSRITGFARVWVTAYALGAGLMSSAYTIANNVPNMIYELVAGGILSALFIPTFMEVKNERGSDGAWKFASHVFNIFIIALGAVALVGTIWPEPFIWTQTFLNPTSNGPELREAASFFFRFFAIQVMLYGGGMIIQSVLNARRKYLWTALGPIFNNLVVIAFLFAYTLFPQNQTTLTWVAIGTTLGVAAMFAVMLPSMIKLDFKYHFELGLADPAVRKMLRLAWPTLIYVITNLVAVTIRTAAATNVSVSGPAIVMFANTWSNLPYGILAVALATAVYTELSSFATKGDMAGFKKTLTGGLRSTALLILPTSAMLYALATPLLSLFRGGKFTDADIPAVASVLRIWAVTIVFFACMMFVLRAFYSLKDTKSPALTNLFTSLVQIAGYLVLTTGIHSWPGLGVNGIPLADGIFYFLQFGALMIWMRRKIGSFDIKSFFVVFAKMALASVIAAAATLWIANRLSPYFSSGRLGALAIIIIAGLIGLVIAFGLAWLMRVEELSLLTNLLGRIIGRGSAKQLSASSADSASEVEADALLAEEEIARLQDPPEEVGDGLL